MLYSIGILPYGKGRSYIMNKKLKQNERNSKRNGFTILELIIVIAVISILASVAIPTFAGVVKKARISARTQVAQNINKILTLEEITDGRPNSMYDAMKVIVGNGFDADEFTYESGLALAWNQEDNRIAVVDEALNEVYTHDGESLPEDKVLIWQVVDELPSESATSIYLGDGFAESEISVGVGVDVGDNLDVESIVFSDSDEEIRSILIRANGNKTVTDVNNNSDNITLLGAADKATLRSSEINDENNLSIYESLADFSIYSGNAVIKSGASVDIVRLLSEKQSGISLRVENGDMIIVGEDFSLIIEDGAHVGSIVGPDGNTFDFSDEDDSGDGDNTGGGENTEGGETTKPDTPEPDNPEPENPEPETPDPEKPEPELPDPYYGFRIFDTSKLKTDTGAEAYFVDYESTDEDSKYVSLLKALENAREMEEGFGYIILLCDLSELEGGSPNHTIYIDKNIILDLNGHTLSNTGNKQDKIIIEYGGHLKLIDTSESKNGSINASLATSNYNPSAISMKEGASLTVYDGNISGAAAAIYAEGSATITIKRGRFENTESGATIVLAAKANLYITDGTFIRKDLEKENIFAPAPNANGSTVVVDGGTFGNKIATYGNHYTLTGTLIGQ